MPANAAGGQHTLEVPSVHLFLSLLLTPGLNQFEEEKVQDCRRIERSKRIIHRVLGDRDLKVMRVLVEILRRVIISIIAHRDVGETIVVLPICANVVRMIIRSINVNCFAYVVTLEIMGNRHVL